jgi:hypothetical protein
MKFNYYLVGSGWARLDIELNDQKLEYWDSLSMGGSLYELLEGILVVLEVNCDFQIADLCDYIDKKLFTWLIDEEGSTVELIFEVNKEKDKALLKIIQHQKLDEVVFDGEIDFNKFLNDIINSCDTMLNKYGIIGYIANGLHCGDFPLTYYLILKNYLSKDKQLSMEAIFEKFGNNEKEDFLLKTNLDKELNLIKLVVAENKYNLI